MFLAAAGCAENRYFISREACDIANILNDRLISLILIYHNHIAHDEGPVPLFPWLHSTETCEHVFGELCKLVKDFCYLDFLYAMPKLCILFKSALLQHGADPHTCAEGYAHTWFDTKGVDYVALATYPMDAEIDKLL